MWGQHDTARAGAALSAARLVFLCRCFTAGPAPLKLLLGSCPLQGLMGSCPGNAALRWRLLCRQVSSAPITRLTTARAGRSQSHMPPCRICCGTPRHDASSAVRQHSTPEELTSQLRRSILYMVLMFF